MNGARFGMLTVVNMDESRATEKHKYWICKCDCGKIKSIETWNLKSGRQISCGCANRKHKPTEIGTKFERLTVVSSAETTNKKRHFECVCICGNTVIAQENNLKSGHTRSCGCLQKEHRAGRIIDLAGRKFGRLTAIERVGTNKHNHPTWSCLCDCGKTIVTEGAALRQGHTRSCGCLVREVSAKTIRRISTTHGMTKHSEFVSWSAMISRCSNPNNIGFKDYGGRGITVCSQWRESFESFFSDMGPKPTKKHSIDRIDNNGPYNPDNCRWASALQQNANKRNLLMITFRGETKHLAQWCRELNLPSSTITNRIARGWLTEDALTRPVRKHVRKNHE